MTDHTEREAIAREIAKRDGDYAVYEDYLDDADRIIAEYIDPLREERDEARKQLYDDNKAMDIIRRAAVRVQELEATRSEEMSKEKERVDAYLDILKRLEPDIAMVDGEAALTSIAVSLKRIADGLDRLKGPVQAHSGDGVMHGDGLPADEH